MDFFIFSKCDSEWRDCIEEDENYLRQNTDYYFHNYADQCPAYDKNSPFDPYPGQPVVPNTVPDFPDFFSRRQETLACTSTKPADCRVLKKGSAERLRCDETCQSASGSYEAQVSDKQTKPCESNQQNSVCQAKAGFDNL